MAYNTQHTEYTDWLTNNEKIYKYVNIRTYTNTLARNSRQAAVAAVHHHHHHHYAWLYACVRDASRLSVICNGEV